MSHGPFSAKLPALRAHASLALNRELNEFDHWDEACANKRGAMLFEIGRRLWAAPQEVKTDYPEFGRFGENGNLPKEGTACRFQYGGAMYQGMVKNRKLEVEGIDGTYTSFSGASVAVTQTSRNGWNDWELEGREGWILSDLWRSKSGTSEG